MKDLTILMPIMFLAIIRHVNLLLHKVRYTQRATTFGGCVGKAILEQLLCSLAAMKRAEKNGNY